MIKEALTVLGIGLGVVFVGLVCLIGIIYLMSFFVKLSQRDTRSKKIKHAEVDPESLEFFPVVGRGDITSSRIDPEKRRETVAAVSAAIAEYLGTDISGIRICSVKRVGEAQPELTLEQRRELIAVISAAIASEMGAEVTGIRITSIRRAA